MAVASNIAGNVTVHLALSGLPPSPGEVLRQDTHALRLRMERPVVAAGALLRLLAAASCEELDGGRQPPCRGGESNRRAR